MVIKKVAAIENSFIVLSLVFLTRGLDPILPDLAITPLRYGIVLIALGYVLVHADRVLYLACRSWWMTFITVLIFSSFLWSDFPGFTLERLRAEMLPMTLIGLYLATRFTLKQQLELLGYTFIIIMILSCGVAVISPSIGIGADGSFVGIYSSKNVVSSYGVLSTLTFFSLSQSKKESKKKYWGWFVFSMFFVLLTTSKTGLVTVFLIPTIAYLYSKAQFRGNYTVASWYWLGILVGIIAVLITANWVFLVEGIGGDATLTGRTVIWDFLLDKVSERPWLGYGRATFWAPQTNNDIIVAQQLSYYGTLNGFRIAHSHNGFIDLLLDTGWVGLFIFLGSLIKVSKKVFTATYTALSPETIWSISFLLLFILNNLTESWFFRNSNLFWVLYITLCFSVEKRRISSDLPEHSTLGKYEK